MNAEVAVAVPVGVQMVLAVMERQYEWVFSDGPRSWVCTQTIRPGGIETTWNGEPPPEDAGAHQSGGVLAFWRGYFDWLDQCCVDYAERTGICHRVITEAPWLGFRLRDTASAWTAPMDYNFLAVDFRGDAETLAKVREWATAWDIEALTAELIHARLAPPLVAELSTAGNLASVQAQLERQYKADWLERRSAVITATHQPEQTH